MGLAIMPSLYAWFNIAGGWDPYANTGQLKVALANSDEGIVGDVIPFHVNVGERVVNALAGSEKIGYVVTSEDNAIDGVCSGEYYAAVVIPADFSTNLLSVFSKSPSHPQFDFYVNQKRNPIASIVTGKASTSIQTMINEDFTAAVSETTTELMDELTAVLDDDSMLSVVSRLDDVVSESLGSLRRSASDIRAYKGVITAVKGAADASKSLFGETSLPLDASGKLQDAADGVRQFDEKVSAAEAGASDAIDQGTSSLQDVDTAVDDAFDAADGETDKLLAALQKAHDVATARRDDIQSFYDTIVGLNGQAYDFELDLERSSEEGDATVRYAHSVTTDLSSIVTRTDNVLGYLNDLIGTLESSINDISAAQENTGLSRSELDELVSAALADVDAMRNAYNDNLSGTLEYVAGVIETAAADAEEVSMTIQTEVDILSPLLTGASSGLDDLEKTLGNAADKLDKSADKLERLHKKLEKAATTGDLDLVRTIFGADPDSLVDFFSAPVALDRETVYSIENNGSAMAPYYTTMALWVGGTLMGILIYAGLSERAIKETRAKPRHAYFGRLAFFLAIGFLQSTILLLGDLFFLKIQCDQPLLFMLTGWLASFVFINIIYSLAASFGDVGKAIGVLFMVIQVAGSGGTFPVEMLPKLFQTLYRFLPFVYSENAMREAICGLYGNTWAMSMGTLALYLVPALLLGLVLRKPFVPINEWIEEHLEETKFM